MDERPPPDARRLLDQFDAWRSGDSTPGRTMADLKTGRLPEWLEALDDPRARSLLARWEDWERGTATPAEVLADLAEGGRADVLAGTTV